MKPAVLSVNVQGDVRRHDLQPDELVTVGRASSCGIQISDTSVSREHCVVIYTDGKICINDLHSTHGITQGGARVSRVELRPGDECRLGNALARFEAAARTTQPRSRVEPAPTAPRAAAPAPAPSRTNKQIAGYRVHEKIGEGGFGVVYRAEQAKLGREVALKVLKKADETDQEQQIDAFIEEARAAAKLSDPHLVQVYDVGESDGEHYLSMELVDGGSLAQRLRRDGPMEWPQALRLLRDLSYALKAAHAVGLVHRDVKPGNVLLTAGGQAKLTDLGLAAAEAHAGTIAFMAPEQLRKETLDGRADIYSLGCTVYTALAGKPPFQGDRKEMVQGHVKRTPPSLLDQGHQIPYQLHQLILQSMMAKDPADRPQDADEVLRRLDRLILPTNAAAALDDQDEVDYPSVAPSRSGRARKQKELSARLAAEAVIFSMIAAVVIALLLVLKAISPDLDIYRLIGR